MNNPVRSLITTTSYDRSKCSIGVVHLGFGAFHRAHQAVYIDDYMDVSGDLNWGIAAVNLRSAEADGFESAANESERLDGYYLKSYSPKGDVAVRRVRSHVSFLDWSKNAEQAEDVLCLPTVHLVTITVTESGYYTDPNGLLNRNDPLIEAEAAGGVPQSVYGYLRRALKRRKGAGVGPLTIACCDNIRQNGKMLRQNLLAYLELVEDADLRDWVQEHVSFPCSMVDRITPRSPDHLGPELTELTGLTITSPIMAEEFLQWVLQDDFAGPAPNLSIAGVTITADVDPYEETKIRVLNGGHTALTYLAALKGLKTFDEAMRDEELNAHFWNFETKEVLPAITLQLPFSKEAYLKDIAARFENMAIGDTIARICADGMAKFPIFIRPTLEGCFKQGILPVNAIRSIASWHQFARHVDAGKIEFEYVEPSWADLSAMLNTDAFVTSQKLWGDLSRDYPEFADALRHEIKEMETKWPV